MEKILIDISVHHGHGLVFSPMGAAVLREKYRVIGSLIGCHPRKPLQNVHLGMPLQLLPEEVTLLEEKKVANIVYGKGCSVPPSDEEVEKYDKAMKCRFEQQKVLFQQNQKADFERLKEVIKKGKQAKNKLLYGDECIEESDGQKEEMDKVVLKPLHPLSAYVQIPNMAMREINIHSLEWNFPQTEEEMVRYKTYKEFWERGYFLTCGGKFGGDFLVYPDDPSRCHSFYIAVCVAYEKKLSMIDFISLGRLGVTVKKTVVVCSLDNDGKSCFTSLNWSHVS